MATVNVYLTFGGNCKPAFEFYRSVFGGEFQHVGTFADMPPQKDMPPIPEEYLKRIMHISLPISKETILMGSDSVEWGPKLQEGNNFSISVGTAEKAEATTIFNALAKGGKITMPLQDTFWGSHFGMVTDKFGISWMVNCDLQSTTR